MKSILFCYYEKFWKAAFLEELINLEDIKLEENVSLHIILLIFNEIFNEKCIISLL